MNWKMSGAALALGIALMPILGTAQTIDGTKDAAYGAAKALQASPTRFGDSQLGNVDWANGSELDGGYAVVSGGVLYIMLTGNMESNFNKLELYIDSQAGGQNILRNDNPDVDFNGLNRQAGLTFDSGFESDFWFSCTGGDAGGGVYKMFANFAETLTNGGGTGGYLGNTTAASDGTLIEGNNPFGIRVTINNSNTAGVTDANVGDPGAVASGIEIAIPLAALGNPTGDIKICTFINGSGHDFLSNQVLGDSVLIADNLGEPSLVNFSTIDGNQYFTVSQSTTLDLFPSSYSVTRGVEIGGNDVTKIQSDDDVNAVVQQRFQFAPTLPNTELIAVIGGATGTLSAASITVKVSANSLPFNDTSCKQEIALRDVNTNQFVVVDLRKPTSTEQTVTVDLDAAQRARFIKNDGTIEVAVRVFHLTPLAGAWQMNVDQVKATVTR